MKSTTTVIAIVSLVVGFGGGYFLKGGDAPVAGDHVMPDGSSMSGAMAGMVSGLAGKSGDEFDRAFIEEMVVHHEGAVEMAQQALRDAQHPEIKQMANDIISAQTREIGIMRGWLKSWYGI